MFDLGDPCVCLSPCSDHRAKQLMITCDLADAHHNVQAIDAYDFKRTMVTALRPCASGFVIVVVRKL